MRVHRCVASALTVGLVAAIAVLPATSSARAAVTSSDPVLVGAGDIALCGSSASQATANLLDNIGGTVFTVGDNVQLIGAPFEYTRCYESTWGRFKARTRPAAGNHDYYWPGASGYFGYFGTAAGDPTTGYYSYDLGSWHVVVLNSNCSSAGGCAAGSPQERWLRTDLAASPALCTVAYWHHPMFSSSGTTSDVKPLFQALYDNGAEIVMSGHHHNYERFAPQNPNGAPDNVGVRQFVVGTGGMFLDTFGTFAAQSEAHSGDTLGVLKLTLRVGSYDWEFVPQAGKTYTDAGRSNCH